MKKKIISILSTGIIITSFTLFDVSANVYLEDIHGHWAEDKIINFLKNGYINGYEDGTFRPDKNITRAEFVTIFNNIFKLKECSNKIFNDTKNHWAKQEIDIAITNGVCIGKSDIEFAPDDKITREEAAKMLSNYLKLKDGNIDNIKKYKDYKMVSSWALNDVEGVVENGYMKGYPDLTFKPLECITRAEVVSMLSKIDKDSQQNLSSIEKKIINKQWINSYDIVDINENKIEINYAFHEGLSFDILEKAIGRDEINYKVCNGDYNAKPFNIVVSFKDNNNIKMTCLGNEDYVFGDYTLASKNQIIKIAHEKQGGLIFDDIEYDNEYCINNYDYLRLRGYGITLDDVISFYQNNKN